MSRRRRARGATGFSLVETLVALALGLALIAAAGVSFVAAGATHRLHDAAARVHESGSVAFELLSRHLRSAGFAEVTRDPRTHADFSSRFGALPILGCAGGYPDSVAAADPGSCVPDPDGNDAFLVRHQALPDPLDPDARLPAYDAATGVGADCLGQGPGVSIVATSVFRVANGALSCMGSGNPGRWQPVVAGVEQMRLRFGADVDGDGAVDGYLPAGDARLAAASAWVRVRTVDVCLLVRVDDRVVTDAATALRDCDGTPRGAADGRLRRVFRSTLAVPNGDPETAVVRHGAVP